ncbi:amidohydrolase family protein [Spirosoma foliorum]|uniref:Amidohydrolase family protein n=1 Tax=Spirosoma foliorum TaxID=2710596 RepID=A0A7G5GUE0_9BACT|nr:amidohydrolase family protein [Spirosoma foliorum]QMW02482.1 amidohydrolase family protein [Spirosoma foliorum]
MISAVGKRLAYPKGTTIINLSQHTLTPGLIDMHTHLLFFQKQTPTGFEDGARPPAEERVKRGLGFAKQDLNAGITTVRDVGNSGRYLNVRLKELLARDAKLGPDLFASGPIISPPGGQFGKLAPADSLLIPQEYTEIKGVDQAKAAVLEHIKHGVDVIKICANTYDKLLSVDEIKAIVETAHARNIPVTAHATYDEPIRNAVLGGVDGIEHGYSVSDSTLALMAARHVYLVPTDVSRRRGKILVAGLGMMGKTAQLALQSLDAFHERLRRAVKKGVMIVSGCDFYNDVNGLKWGPSSVDVLVGYREAGLSVPEVLSFATINAAKALHRSDSIGIVKKGMQANLVVFSGDLETNFEKSLFDVEAVFHKGKLVHQKTKK